MTNVPVFQNNPCQPPIVEKTLFRPYYRTETSCNLNLQNYTQKQLDMRLKYHVLQHQQKGDQLTKAQRYAMASRRNYQPSANQIPSAFVNENGTIIPSPGYKIVNNTIVCESPPGTIYTLTNKSDVPGPVINLFLDNTVPLRNTDNTRRTYLGGAEKLIFNVKKKF